MTNERLLEQSIPYRRTGHAFIAFILIRQVPLVLNSYLSLLKRSDHPLVLYTITETQDG